MLYLQMRGLLQINNHMRICDLICMYDCEFEHYLTMYLFALFVLKFGSVNLNNSIYKLRKRIFLWFT